MVWGVVFIIAVTVFFTGKSKNAALAMKWKKACSEVIGQNFAHLGTGKEPSLDLE